MHKRNELKSLGDLVHHLVKHQTDQTNSTEKLKPSTNHGSEKQVNSTRENKEHERKQTLLRSLRPEDKKRLGSPFPT